MAYRYIMVPSFSRFLLVTRFFLRDYLPTAPTDSFLKALVPSGSLAKCQSTQLITMIQSFSFTTMGQSYPEWLVLPRFRLIFYQSQE
jgi:hypothetical protein